MNILVAIIACVFMLVGCTPTYNFSLPDVKPANHKLNADLKEITISYGKKDFNDPDLIINIDTLSQEEKSQYIVPAWGMALHDTLKRLSLFDKSAAKKITLALNVQEIDVPWIGSSFTSRILANYQLIDRGTDKILFNEIINTEGTVPWNYAFSGTTRAIESINRAVRNNISVLIARLKALGHL